MDFSKEPRTYETFSGIRIFEPAKIKSYIMKYVKTQNSDLLENLSKEIDTGKDLADYFLE